jgi:enoyl-CoA hydratase/carnithine racemase
VTYECFSVDVTDKVAHVRLNRPDALNTMIPSFWSELPTIIDEISRKGEARAVVLSSTGKHFSAGMDLAVFTSGGFGTTKGETGRVRSNLRLGVSRLQDSFSSLERARMPVLAAIHGGCIGGAVDMVSACDMRYATSDAFFCIQEINIGMTADVGTLQRLPKIIPEGLARQWAYTGERVPADRAFQAGFVNEVFADHDSLVDGTLEIAREIASKSPLAIWGTKEMINYTRDHTTTDALDYIATWQTGMFQPADMTEAFAAKADKRDPEYDDLIELDESL